MIEVFTMLGSNFSLEYLKMVGCVVLMGRDHWVQQDAKTLL